MAKMFGHRSKKKADSGRTPGEPFNTAGYDRGDENEGSYSYVKSKDVKEDRFPEGKSKGGPKNYEGAEHMKYKEPGYTRHKIKFPEDEPHMKSYVDKNEKHEMEDNYHMDVPDQTKYELEKKLKRARMKMDAPDQEEPKKLRGNMTTSVPSEGVVDTTGEEQMGPNDMQAGMGKKNRKKMIAAIVKRKMKK